VRELVQNADDARAERLVFAVVDGGWLDARNSLLRGSALLVANNGSFLAKDRDALHQALGGSKADDTAKVGRFGIGLKSVFHICEAIVYVGAEGGTPRAGALNPWAGTGVGNADPLHPDWDAVEDDDFDRLKEAALELLGQFHDTLLIWIPLRCPAHLDRAEGSSYGLGEFCPAPEEIARWFGRSASLTLLVAQCGYLRSIEAVHASAPSSLAARTPLVRVIRPGSKQSRWIGRYDDDPVVPDRTFEGVIETNVGNNCGDRWSVLGVEALGHDDLRELRSNDHWPIELVPSNSHVAEVPRKALAHAAVTVLRSQRIRYVQCHSTRLALSACLPAVCKRGWSCYSQTSACPHLPFGGRCHIFCYRTHVRRMLEQLPDNRFNHRETIGHGQLHAAR